MELRALVLDGERVAAHRAGESTLRENAQALERYVSTRLVDAAKQRLFRQRIDEDCASFIIFGAGAEAARFVGALSLPGKAKCELGRL
jgi:hypothetical protein